MSIIVQSPLSDIFIVHTRSPRASIPYFLNFREEDGRFRVDAAWKKIPVTHREYAEHILDLDDDAPYPYRFEHFHEAHGGRKFSLTDQQLEFWRDAALAQPRNHVNDLLSVALNSAFDYMQKFKSGKTVQLTSAAPSLTSSPN